MYLQVLVRQNGDVRVYRGGPLGIGEVLRHVQEDEVEVVRGDIVNVPDNVKFYRSWEIPADKEEKIASTRCHYTTSVFFLASGKVHCTTYRSGTKPTTRCYVGQASTKAEAIELIKRAYPKAELIIK